MVSGDLNVCPTIDGIGANPAEVEVGGTHRPLGRGARQRRRPGRARPTPGRPARGTLSNATARTRPSPATRRALATVSLTVSDGDPAASCAATLTAQVNCTVADEDARHLRRRRLPQPHDLLGRLDLDAEAGQEGDRQGRDARGASTGSCRPATAATATATARWSKTRRWRRPAYPLSSAGRRARPRPGSNSGVTPQGRRLGHRRRTATCGAGSRSRSSSTRCIEYLERAQEPAAVHRHRVGRSPATSTPRCRSSPARCRRRSTRRTLPTDAAAYTAARQRQRARAVGVLLRPRRHRHEPRHARSNNWDCAVPGSANAADPSWNATAQKLIPAGGAGTGTRGHVKTARSAEVDGGSSTRTTATTCRPTSSAPARSTRTATTASTSSTCATSTTPRRRSRSASRRSPATAPPTTAASTRSLRNNIGGVHDRQRRRHDLRRHRRLRRAGRRRVGRAARRRPQLLVLRQLRLAQPRQLRPRRSPHDAGLLSRASTSATTRWCATAATSCGRRRSSTACARGNSFATQRPAHRPPRLRRLRSYRHGATRRCVVEALAVERGDQQHRHRARRAAPRWARSWSVPAGRGHRRRRSRCAIRRARTTRRTPSPNPSLRRSASTSR